MLFTERTHAEWDVFSGRVYADKNQYKKQINLFPRDTSVIKALQECILNPCDFPRGTQTIHNFYVDTRAIMCVH